MKLTRFSKLPYVVLLFVLAACQAPARSAPTSAAPAPTAVGPSEAPAASASQAPTTTASKAFKLPFSFTTDGTWHISEDYSDVVTLESDRYGVDLAIMIVKDAQIADPSDGFANVAFPDDFVTWIQAHGLFPDVKTQPVVVAGFPGVQIDAIVTADCGSKKNWLFLSSTGWNCRQGEYYRFITLNDVYGQRVIIMNTGGSLSEQDFKAGVQASQNVLDTLSFTAPAAAAAPATTAFSSKAFELPLSAQLAADWSVAEEYHDVLTLSFAGHDAGLSFMSVKHATIAGPEAVSFPSDFLGWLQSDSSLFQVVDSKPVLVDGLSGVQINATATCGAKKEWVVLSATGWRCPQGEHLGLIYLADVYGEPLLIQIQGSPDGADYAFIVAESQKVLDTVSFSKPAAAGAPATTAFTPKAFKLPLSFVLASTAATWTVVDDLADNVYLLADPNLVDMGLLAVDTVDISGPAAPFSAMPFPVDFDTWIKSHGLFQVVATQPVVMGGYPGTQTDAIGTEACGRKTDWIFPSTGSGWNCAHGQYFRFVYFADIHGQRLLILMTGGSTGSTAAQEFKRGTDASQQLLDSVVFPQS